MQKSRPGPYFFFFGSLLEGFCLSWRGTALRLICIPFFLLAASLSTSIPTVDRHVALAMLFELALQVSPDSWTKTAGFHLELDAHRYESHGQKIFFFNAHSADSYANSLSSSCSCCVSGTSRSKGNRKLDAVAASAPLWSRSCAVFNSFNPSSLITTPTRRPFCPTERLTVPTNACCDS